MALIKKAVDTVNKRVQFPISDSCTGISYAFTGGENLAAAVISVILVEENQPNKVLYKFQKLQIDLILQFAFSKAGYDFLPFAVGKDLMLSKTKHLIVEFAFSQDVEDDSPTEIQYETVLSPEYTDQPIEIKTVAADGGDIEFSSENYTLVRVLAGDTSLFSAQTFAYLGDKTVPKNLRYTDSYLSTFADESGYSSVVLPHDTKVSANANSAIYLIKF